MSTNSKAINGTGAALLLAGFLWTHGAIGQGLKPGDIPAPHLDRASCEEVNWHRDLLGSYPWVTEACHEVIVVDGQKWARFQGVFQRMNRDGSMTSEFRNRQGRARGSIELMPGPDQRVTLDGRPYRFSELRPGQTLDFYVPEGMYAFSIAPGASPAQLVKVVQAPVEPRSQPAPVQLADVQQQPYATPSRLPGTASPLPLVGLTGALSLLVGFGLGLRRRQQARKA